MLNRQHRGIDRTTDVLSFPQYEENIQNPALNIKNYAVGDIVINLHKAKRQAAENGVTLNDELKRLMIHGLLHLLGYDHEKNARDGKKMLAKEKELFDAL